MACDKPPTASPATENGFPPLTSLYYMPLLVTSTAQMCYHSLRPASGSGLSSRAAPEHLGRPWGGRGGATRPLALSAHSGDTLQSVRVSLWADTMGQTQSDRPDLGLTHCRPCLGTLSLCLQPGGTLRGAIPLTQVPVWVILWVLSGASVGHVLPLMHPPQVQGSAAPGVRACVVHSEGAGSSSSSTTARLTVVNWCQRHHQTGAPYWLLFVWAFEDWVCWARLGHG